MKNSASSNLPRACKKGYAVILPSVSRRSYGALARLGGDIAVLQVLLVVIPCGGESSSVSRAVFFIKLYAFCVKIG